ncbi:hypothetical protein CBR_g9042 [Chara braunii]|uniref:Reverse transcriptase/retrotransposon-derived protein RNase H-like domain-containing protein n=1 Tax=Chara braunii TaxID=69332 RepID=A0A388KNJ2_CHABU|nr:hypothetical protein CBR_g9042 [Chara braunii]|eukprot:GBG71626.1 hypothetical protein CBR_g9042 [Chara braunii]
MQVDVKDGVSVVLPEDGAWTDLEPAYQTVILEGEDAFLWIETVWANVSLTRLSPSLMDLEFRGTVEARGWVYLSQDGENAMVVELALGNAPDELFRKAEAEVVWAACQRREMEMERVDVRVELGDRGSMRRPDPMWLLGDAEGRSWREGKRFANEGWDEVSSKVVMGGWKELRPPCLRITAWMPQFVADWFGGFEHIADVADSMRKVHIECAWLTEEFYRFSLKYRTFYGDKAGEVITIPKIGKYDRLEASPRLLKGLRQLLTRRRVEVGDNPELPQGEREEEVPQEVANLQRSHGDLKDLDKVFADIRLSLPDREGGEIMRSPPGTKLSFHTLPVGKLKIQIGTHHTDPLVEGGAEITLIRRDFATITGCTVNKEVTGSIRGAGGEILFAGYVTKCAVQAGVRESIWSFQRMTVKEEMDHDIILERQWCANVEMIGMHLHDGSYTVDIEDPVTGRGELLRLLGMGGDPPKGKLATWSPSFEDSTRKGTFARMKGMRERVEIMIEEAFNKKEWIKMGLPQKKRRQEDEVLGVMVAEKESEVELGASLPKRKEVRVGVPEVALEIPDVLQLIKALRYHKVGVDSAALAKFEGEVQKGYCLNGKLVSIQPRVVKATRAVPTVNFLGGRSRKEVFESTSRMLAVVGDMFSEKCEPYIDDNPIKGAEENDETEVQLGIRKFVWDHLQDIEDLLRRFLVYNITASGPKSILAVPEVTILGFRCGAYGRKPDPAKTDKISQWSTPLRTATEVRAFLCVVGFWRIFIKNFVKIAEPIRAMIREDGTMDWTEEREGAVQKLKDILTSETVALSAPCFNDEVGRPFILETDGEPLAVGGVLIQRDAGEKERPIRFESRTLNSAVRRYSQFKKEVLAILHCLKTFHAHLFGRRFILRIDPMNVAEALKNYRPIDPTVGRWEGFIWQFDYKIEWIAGIRNKADGLSRVCITPEGMEDVEPIDAFLEYEGGTLAVDNEMMSGECTSGELLIQTLEKGAPAVVAELKEGSVTTRGRREEKDSWGAIVGPKEELIAMVVEGGRETVMSLVEFWERKELQWGVN